jgi:hypothetical protein
VGKDRISMSPMKQKAFVVLNVKLPQCWMLSTQSVPEASASHAHTHVGRFQNFKVVARHVFGAILALKNNFLNKKTVA